MIEERSSFAGEILRLPPAAREVHMFGTDETLIQNEDSGFLLPAVKGRLLLEVRGHFKK